ncbi:hypothetical protein LCGC14_0442130 [marine sediment metagenome]|uniref:Uncharacterized protein n=1 Tax=marine sediment metagenome TaxID=412755 RepID=A0A0F9VUF1_9ZZZZ
MNVINAQKRWEKAFKKEMSDEEFTMFNWGYTYAINDTIECSQKTSKKSEDEK